MKRKLTTILLSLIMVLGLFVPKFSAYAVEPDQTNILYYSYNSGNCYIRQNGITVYNGGTITISTTVTNVREESGSYGYDVYVDGTRIGNQMSTSGTLSSSLAPGKYTVSLRKGTFIEIKFTSLPADPPAPDGDSSGYYIDPLVDDIAIAAEYSNGEEATVTWDTGDSLPLEIMKQLQDNPNIELDFSFTYEGVQHRVLIPAGKAIVDEDITWYGPLWLIKMYGEYDGKKTSEYTVVSGDTLGGLAKKWGTTVDELMKLNPDIKDRDKIYPGDTIVH